MLWKNLHILDDLLHTQTIWDSHDLRCIEILKHEQQFEWFLL